AICGYTQEELERDFKEHIEYTAKELKMTEEKLLSEIKRWYNGYSWDGEVLVYNPFSTLLFFDNKRFAGHWFETEMPTFLIEEIKKKEDVEKFVEEQRVMDSTLRDSSREIETVSLLFQTGYLTIKKEEYVERTIWYTLDFPNYEVKEAFLSSLMKEYTLKKAEEIKGINKKIEESLVEKDGERLGRSLEELLANIPYDLHTKRESYYHSLFLLANEDEWI
ncbi:MAG: AAA family ATPase, partial [Endomicrobium sp.]|nr:AAA family ATPase [Endomicrobium sp.]